MSKPLPPDPRSVDWPNALQIAKLCAEIGQLHDIKRDRDSTAKAQIADQIRQRESAQLFLYQQISGHRDATTFGADQKRFIAERIDERIGELSRQLTYLSAHSIGGNSPEASPQISRLTDQIGQLRTFAGLLIVDDGGR
jgi:hypothetical protein